MEHAPRPISATRRTAEASVPRMPSPVLANCGCGPNCQCGCQGGGSCQCGGGCG